LRPQAISNRRWRLWIVLMPMIVGRASKNLPAKSGLLYGLRWCAIAYQAFTDTL
jgi:hypothetical protein